GKEVEGAAAAGEVTLDPVQLEAAKGERDHLGAWSPDRPPGQRTEREAQPDDDKGLAPDLAVDQQEAGPRDQPKGDRQTERAGRRVNEPHQHLGQVLVVRPDVIWDS